jgi:eukaryotic-like serine/threonine-protein kinase
MGLLKHKILLLVVLLLISGCARSLIKYATKLDDNPYRMYGKIPSRDFYLPANISDSLVLKWESEVNGGFPNSSVSIYEDLVFINDLSGRIFCFNIESGKRIGSLKYSSGSVYSTPVPFRSKIIFPVAYEKENITELIIYDYNQGKELENIELPGRALTQMIAIDDDVLFTTEVGITFKFNSSGKKVWETHTRVPTRSSPALAGNLFIFGNDNGEIIALNSTSGDSVYVQNIGGHFFSGLTISENIIYAGNDNGFVYALDSKDGRIIWQFDTGARIKMEPSFDEQNIYIGNVNGNFYSLKKQNGNENWRTNFRGILNTTPLITGNIIILPNVLFEIHFLDKQSGNLIKSIPLDGRAKLSPVIHRNILFIGYDDGIIRAYEIVN